VNSEGASGWYTTVGGTPGVVSIVAALVITVVVSRYYFQKARLTKQLAWAPLSLSRIVTSPVSSVSEGLALTWNGRPLEMPYTIAVRVSNTGSREVLGDGRDYQRPLSVQFSDGTVYEAVITEAPGTVLETPTSIVSEPCKEFEVPMPTLNSGASVTIEMIVDGETELPKIDTLLVGETREINLGAATKRRQVDFWSLAVGAIAIFLLTLGFALFGYQASTFENGPSLWPLVLMGISGFAFVGALAAYLGSRWFARAERNALLRRLRDRTESSRHAPPSHPPSLDHRSGRLPG